MDTKIADYLFGEIVRARICRALLVFELTGELISSPTLLAEHCLRGMLRDVCATIMPDSLVQSK
jgi:hypothetical protein